MVSEIKYSGYSATPSDYECPDGDLADVIGLMPDEGSLAPIQPPVKVMDTQWDHQLMFVHKGDSYTNFIFKDGALGLFWAQQGGSPQLISTYDAEIYQVTAIGNTLVVLTSNGIFYALWKGGVEDKYINLGKMPECPISFGLQGESRYYSKMDYEKNPDSEEKTNGKFKITFDSIGNLNDPLTKENKAKITNQILAKVNKFVEEVSTSENRFIFPFLVRYAFRLYDNSLYKISAPVLMIPCTKVNPHCFIYTPLNNTSSEADIFTISTLLDYQALISETEKETLLLWKDIIKSIDIFISAPIYTYDQSGECERFERDLGMIFDDCRFVGKFVTSKVRNANDDVKISQYYQSWSHSDLCGYENDGSGYSATRIVLPEFTDEDIDKKIRDCASFYFLTSIDVEDISTTRKEVPIEEGTLASLVVHEAMTDDYQQHDTLIAKRALGYNGRLNLSGVQRHLFEGFNLSAMTCYANGRNILSYRVADGTADYPLYFSYTEEGVTISLYWELHTDEGVFLLKTDSSLLMSPMEADYNYLYYPDTFAKKLIFVGSRDWQQGMYRTAEPHSMLNGSLCYRSLRAVKPSSPIDSTLTVSNNDVAVVNALNKIYTSEVNNPFFFPLLGINAVGNGEVIGISSAAKALSQGQFGQFPLYAFTTEGVWALEVAANGSYSARQPISRDVCTRPNSITQMDNTVLFATDRGIMLLSGSEAVCISDILNSEETMSLYDLPYGRELAEQELQLDGDAIQKEPFLDFLNGLNTGMIYDYTGQRIIVYNQQKQYAYVFSLKSKRWGIMYSDIWKGIPSYPNAYAQVPGVGVVDFSIINHENVQGYFVTRPLKMETKDILKTVNTVIQRGYFNKGAVKSVLWGSRDLRSWHLVASSVDHYMRGFRGTPYKYYRIGGFFQLEAKDRIFGSTVQFDPKDNNQPR